MTLSQMELNHVKANAQGEKPIKIIKKSKKEIDEFIAKKLQTKTEAQKQEYIKVYNQSAAAGYGNYLDDDSFEMVSVPSVPHGAEFGIRIQGDSMEPKIHDGNIVFVQRKPDLEPGEIGIFIYNSDSYCKQLIYKSGAYYLHSLNDKYADISLSGDSIYCVGKVIF
jgi:phage repressor protein C with HTH and peptisase S24 domain